MTVYKALAMYLQTKTSTLSNTFYPIQAPQNASRPYCVFSIIDDNPITTHEGDYKHGVIIIQFDIYCNSLADVDDRASKIKDHFVGQSHQIHSDVQLCYGVSQNEFDAFDDDEQINIRSFDLRFTYIKS